MISKGLERTNLNKITPVLILFTLFLTTCTPASSPMSVEIDVEGVPIVEAPVDVFVTVSTLENADHIDFSLRHTAGIELVEGSPSWQGSLQKGESVVLSFTVKVLEEGDWPLAAYAFNSYAADSDAGFGDGETLYLVSRLNHGEVITRSEYKGTPSSPIINQPEQTLPPIQTE